MESSTKEEKMKMGVPRIMDCVGGSEDPQRAVARLESYEKKTVLLCWREASPVGEVCTRGTYSRT
jgi:hypothetical protein